MKEHKRGLVVAANWKMNLNWDEAIPLAYQIAEIALPESVQVILGVPYVYINKIAGISADNKSVKIAAQNCHESDSGAFTGEISASMIKSIGASSVIIGHSERRQLYKEDNVLLKAKTENALKNDLDVIFCVGETLEERESGQQLEVVDKQLTEAILGLGVQALRKITVAYEPVWAIGTGKTASPEQAQDMHAFIRRRISEVYPGVAQSMHILYGGSVKPNNATTLFSMADIDGGLVGGASLKFDDFNGIIEAAVAVTS
jgi:triosephosphate isomerase